MSIQKDEGWREIKEAIVNLLVAYDVNEEDALKFGKDLEDDLVTFSNVNVKK